MSDPETGTVENPSQPLFKVRLLNVPKENALMVRFLGKLSSCYVHWINKRSVPCPGAERCPRKQHDEETHWRAYAAVEYWRPEPDGDWAPAVLEVTENFGDKLRGRNLVGEVWKIYRVRTSGKHKECSGHLHEVGRPAMVDSKGWIETVLWRLYRTLDIEWGVEPLIPPPIAIAPRKAPPPASKETATKEQKPLSKEELRAMLAKAGLGSAAGKAVTQ